MTSRRCFLAAPLALIVLQLCACTPHEDSGVTAAPGVTFRRDGASDSGFQVLDVDLATTTVRPVVVAEKVARVKNNFVGDAFTVREWCEKYRAVGGMNGGFFGDTYDDIGSRKQIVQLAVVDGKVVAPGSDVASTRVPGERYLRSAVGFTAEGTPEIAWATGTIKHVLRAYDAPVNPVERKDWENIQYAVACGPRLFAGGVRRITDREERLVSKDPLVRAFIAYDVDANNKPQHLLLGRADNAAYADIATFLEHHFKDVWQTTPHEAMCLDGGPSSQIVYKSGEGGQLQDAEPTGVRVPTAILLVPKK